MDSLNTTDAGRRDGSALERGVRAPAPKPLHAHIWQATRRMLCPHTHGRLLAIEWDGETVHECAACGKHVRRPL